MSIPRRIIQTHRSPDLHADLRATWAAHHPDYELLFFTDAQCRDLIAQRYPELLTTWERLPLPVQKSDLFRYAAIHALGGVYTDVDTVCCAPVDSYVDMQADRLAVGIEMSLAHWSGPLPAYTALGYVMPVQVLQWTFAAPPGHPVLARMLQRIAFLVAEFGASQLEQWSTDGHFTLQLTGPHLFTQVINETLAGPDAASIAIHERAAWGLLPDEQERSENQERMKVRHLFLGSWRPAPAT